MSIMSGDKPVEFEVGQVVEVAGQVGVIMQQASFVDFDGQAYIEHFVSFGANGSRDGWFSSSQLKELVDISKIGH